MLEVAVDLADDRFDVRHDPERIGATDLVEAVRALGYSPEIVGGGHGRLLGRQAGFVEPQAFADWLTSLSPRRAASPAPGR